VARVVYRLSLKPEGPGGFLNNTSICAHGLSPKSFSPLNLFNSRFSFCQICCWVASSAVREECILARWPSVSSAWTHFFLRVPSLSPCLVFAFFSFFFVQFLFWCTRSSLVSLVFGSLLILCRIPAVSRRVVRVVSDFLSCAFFFSDPYSSPPYAFFLSWSNPAFFPLSSACSLLSLVFGVLVCPVCVVCLRAGRRSKKVDSSRRFSHVYC